jgi:hypothetical protein
LYFNTTDEIMKVYTGSTWVDAYAAGTTFLAKASNLSDLTNAATARINLGVAIGTDVQAYSSVLDATTASFTTAKDSKLSGIETGADVTDATNVNAAGAVMNTDTSTSDMSFVVDEDTMVSNSATKVPTQQSVKAYVDTQIATKDSLGELSGTLDDITDGATYKKFSITEQNKLSGIETGATADQTASEIKTAYESNADTNAFTDTEKGKLSGIETLADVTDATNVAAAGAAMDGDFTSEGLMKRGATQGSYSIVTDNSTNWDTAYGWGDHSQVGYLTGITGLSIKDLSDVYDSMSPSDGQVLTYDTTNGWQAETPVVTASSTNTFTNKSGNISQWTNDSGYLTTETSHADVVVDGDFASQGLMKRGATAGSYSIVTDNSTNWDTAYGWGNHASAGYLTGITGQSIKNLSDVYSSMTPSDGQVLTYDTTNGWQAESPAASSSFPSGTLMLFAQTAAPTGWTKSTTHNNKALRVVSGTASSGGSVDFTTAFASKTPAGSVTTSTTVSSTTATNQAATQSGSVSTTLSGGSIGSYTLAVADIPAHTHTYTRALLYDDYVGGSGTSARISYSDNTGSTGGGGSHTHTHTNPTASSTFTGSSHNHTQDSHTHTATSTSSFSGSAINLAVQYVDVIIASKD